MTALLRWLVVIAGCLIAGALTLPTAGLAAQTDQGTFDLQIRGFSAGVLQFSGSEDGGRYAVAGKLESSGVAAMLRKVRYDAKTSGRVAGGRWSPARYEEQADTGKRQSQSLLDYRGGVPRERLKPSRADNPAYVDPATQKGTVDPLTALYALLRDMPEAEACNLKLVLFDGARRSQIALGVRGTEGGAITCAGEYRRLAGFSAAELAEKQRFAFRVTYGPAGTGRVRVVLVTMETLYGRAALTRR
jgi:Protein of unknown function (DUF3108)